MAEYVDENLYTLKELIKQGYTLSPNGISAPAGSGLTNDDYIEGVRRIRERFRMEHGADNAAAMQSYNATMEELGQAMPLMQELYNRQVAQERTDWATAQEQMGEDPYRTNQPVPGISPYGDAAPNLRARLPEGSRYGEGLNSLIQGGISTAMTALPEPVIQAGNWLGDRGADVASGIASTIEAGKQMAGLATSPNVGQRFNQAIQTQNPEALIDLTTVREAGQNPFDTPFGQVTPEQIGRFAGESLLPRTYGELALELVPGIGTVPGVTSAINKSGIIQKAAATLIERGVPTERAASILARLARNLGPEVTQGAMYAGIPTGNNPLSRILREAEAYAKADKLTQINPGMKVLAPAGKDVVAGEVVREFPNGTVEVNFGGVIPNQRVMRNALRLDTTIDQIPSGGVAEDVATREMVEGLTDDQLKRQAMAAGLDPIKIRDGEVSRKEMEDAVWGKLEAYYKSKEVPPLETTPPPAAAPVPLGESPLNAGDDPDLLEAIEGLATGRVSKVKLAQADVTLTEMMKKGFDVQESRNTLRKMSEGKLPTKAQWQEFLEFMKGNQKVEDGLTRPTFEPVESVIERLRTMDVRTAHQELLSYSRPQLESIATSLGMHPELYDQRALVDNIGLELNRTTKATDKAAEVSRGIEPTTPTPENPIVDQTAQSFFEDLKTLDSSTLMLLAGEEGIDISLPEDQLIRALVEAKFPPSKTPAEPKIPGKRGRPPGKMNVQVPPEQMAQVEPTPVRKAPEGLSDRAKAEWQYVMAAVDHRLNPTDETAAELARRRNSSYVKSALDDKKRGGGAATKRINEAIEAEVARRSAPPVTPPEVTDTTPIQTPGLEATYNAVKGGTRLEDLKPPPSPNPHQAIHDEVAFQLEKLYGISQMDELGLNFLQTEGALFNAVASMKDKSPLFAGRSPKELYNTAAKILRNIDDEPFIQAVRQGRNVDALPKDPVAREAAITSKVEGASTSSATSIDEITQRTGLPVEETKEVIRQNWKAITNPEALTGADYDYAVSKYGLNPEAPRAQNIKAIKDRNDGIVLMVPDGPPVKEVIRRATKDVESATPAESTLIISAEEAAANRLIRAKRKEDFIKAYLANKEEMDAAAVIREKVDELSSVIHDWDPVAAKKRLRDTAKVSEDYRIVERALRRTNHNLVSRDLAELDRLAREARAKGLINTNTGATARQRLSGEAAARRAEREAARTSRAQQAETLGKSGPGGGNTPPPPPRDLEYIDSPEFNEALDLMDDNKRRRLTNAYDRANNIGKPPGGGRRPPGGGMFGTPGWGSWNRPVEKENEWVSRLLGVPRESLATLDFSSFLRQGFVQTVSHPIIALKALGTTGRVFVNALRTGNPEYAERVYRGLGTKYHDLKLLGPKKIHYGLLEEGGFTEGEEAFVESVLENIKGLGRLPRASRYAYMTYLAKLRDDVFDSTMDMWKRGGMLPGIGTPKRITDVSPAGSLRPDSEEVQTLIDWINISTGRGNLEDVPLLGAFKPGALANALFAPKLLASRIQTPIWGWSALGVPGQAAAGAGLGYAITGDEEGALYGAIGGVAGGLPAGRMSGHIPARVRAVLAKDIVQSVGTIGALLYMADKAGVGSLGLDPTSSDFMKLKVGNTRIDPWGGWQPMVRLLAQIGAGEKTTPGGSKYKFEDQLRESGGLLFQWLQGKVAPAPGIIADYGMAAANAAGMTEANRALSGAPLPNIDPSSMEFWNGALSRTVPLLLQDIISSWTDAGVLKGGDLKLSLDKGMSLKLPDVNLSRAPYATARALPSIIGAGASTYETTEEKLNRAIQNLAKNGVVYSTPMDTNGISSPITSWRDMDPWDRRDAKLKSPELRDIIDSLPETKVSKSIEDRITAMNEASDIFKKDGDGRKFQSAIQEINEQARLEFASLPNSLPANRNEWLKEVESYFTGGKTDSKDYYDIVDAQAQWDKQWRATHTPEQVAKLDQILQGSDNETYAQMKKDRQYIENNYWNVREKTYAVLALQVDPSSPAGQTLAKYTTLDSLKRAAAQNANNPDKLAAYRTLNEVIEPQLSKLMEQLRYNNPQLDAMLYIWGYTDKVFPNTGAPALVKANAKRLGIEKMEDPIVRKR